jgi:hypothetical protein
MKEIKVEVSPEVKMGTYSNTVRISHTPFEFVMDFGRTTPDEQDLIRIVSRIVMSPQHTKAFLQALEENLRRYEAQFGPINLPARSALGKGPEFIQ